MWPDLVVVRARYVHVVDLRQRFQRTDFVEADHSMSSGRGVNAFLHHLELRLSRVGIVDEFQKVIRDALGLLEEPIEIASRDGDLLRLADFDERFPGTWNDRVDIDDSSDGSGRCNQGQEV